MSVWLGAALFVLLFTGCCEYNTSGEKAINIGAASTGTGEVLCTEQGDLSFKGGILSYSANRQKLWSREMRGVEPYYIVCLGPPALVTTVADDLTVTTHAVSQSCYEYPGMYPQVAAPPIVVLSELASDLSAVLPRTVLLGEDGAITWSGKAAEYLPPFLESSDDVAYLAQADSAGDLYNSALFPFGDAPLLTAVNSASATTLWSIELDASASVADVVLWALTPEQGLLSLQYDYQFYEFFCFNRSIGEVRAQYKLAGQPATRLVYPGAFTEPAALSLDGDSVEIGVFMTNGTSQMWNFDLVEGELHRDKFSPLSSVREDNSLPVGGIGAPGYKSAPFSQKLLPDVSGSQWQVPALTDDNGAVLLVVDGKALWLSSNQTNSGIEDSS